SYNPILMVCIWEALATQNATLLRATMEKRFALPADATWINYLRSHDDIGWGFADEDATEIGLNGEDHRWFLNLYYMGRFPGSSAAGEPFQFQVDPRSHKPDIRISGTLASLIGLENAMAARDEGEIDLAIRRIVLAQGLILAAGGIPLIYLGDEIATRNDYDYKRDPLHAHDSRWLHRPQMNWNRAAKRHDPKSIEGRVFQALRRLIWIRKQNALFANGATQWIDIGNAHVIAFARQQKLLVLGNFSDQPQFLGAQPTGGHISLETRWKNLIDDRELSGHDLTLAPYELLWLIPVLD
ncbi:MAG: amylosucrase, partial [Anaerolineae bacterium]|nr:amylosucrase [Anaerolineae bacterium]